MYIYICLLNEMYSMNISDLESVVLGFMFGMCSRTIFVKISTRTCSSNENVFTSL